MRWFVRRVDIEVYRKSATFAQYWTSRMGAVSRTRLTVYVLYTVQWTHLLIAIVLCRNFGIIAFILEKPVMETQQNYGRGWDFLKLCLRITGQGSRKPLK